MVQPELIGTDGADTYAKNSGIVMGTNTPVRAATGGIENYVHYNQPTTTIVGSEDVYLYVCNDGTGNGTTDASTSAVLEIVVEYFGID